MKFYLSSFRLGDRANELLRLMPENKTIAYIPNAGDYSDVNVEQRKQWESEDVKSLEQLGLSVEYLDLKHYFNKSADLRETLNTFGGVFVRGGNTFILRQAMKLSGFDTIFKEFLETEDFLYAGYSAGICVLAPDFKALQIVDDPHDKPYKECQETLWDGLGVLDQMILPHYKSNHPESAAIDEEVAYCKQHKIPFQTLRDGEVIVIEFS
jgi:dipeptidase E